MEQNSDINKAVSLSTAYLPLGPQRTGNADLTRQTSLREQTKAKTEEAGTAQNGNGWPERMGVRKAFAFIRCT